MKVFIKINHHEITTANFLFPPLASRGWKVIAKKLCDRIIAYEKVYNAYEIKGEVNHQDDLKQRLYTLTKEEQQRLSCVVYARPHVNDPTLYYDWWHYSDGKLCLDENKTCYLDEIFIPIPYQARVWLNDGRHPDQDEYRYSVLYTIEDTPNDHESAVDDNELDITSEEYVAAMHHLWDQ